MFTLYNTVKVEMVNNASYNFFYVYFSIHQGINKCKQ